MTYVRSLFLNFLVVFFVDRVIPGIEISQFEHVPDIGADILFAVILGFLNASIYPAFYIFGIQASILRLAIVSFIVSFGGLGIIAAIDYGVIVQTFGGYLLGAVIIWAISLFTNYLEMKHSYPQKK